MQNGFKIGAARFWFVLKTLTDRMGQISKGSVPFCAGCPHERPAKEQRHASRRRILHLPGGISFCSQLFRTNERGGFLRGRTRFETVNKKCYARLRFCNVPAFMISVRFNYHSASEKTHANRRLIPEEMDRDLQMDCSRRDSMRKIININKDWQFAKNQTFEGARGAFEPVNVPHTWNAIDGQDGGNDYWRGTSLYTKTIKKPELAEDEELWLEINGANSSSKVFFNGKEMASHDGGYSTYRVNLTPELKDENVLEIEVDNAPNDHVYPQQADFTFYGGLYRDVNLIQANKAHFALGYWGGLGLKITPEVLEGGKGSVVIEAFTEGAKDGDIVAADVKDAKGNVVASGKAEVKDNQAALKLDVENIHLWDGVKDPYLYTVEASLLQDGKAVDALSQRIGFRTFEIDPAHGFILNGRPYQLIGTARHQDWLGKGNALSKEDHETDMRILKEMGANTIRGAHYQHDQYWYDLADENGMVMWAEIPYISSHMANEKANQNTKDQMMELVIQNYNHPSIAVWGLSNEISIGGESEDLIKNHRELNDLVHELDSTRKTVMAHVNMLDPDSELVTIPDVSSYNLYFGWYLGKLADNDEWFDEFHRKHPNIAIGLSEFGADANPAYHAEKPGRGDYTTDYQAMYHEHILKMLKDRPWIWATHVWNGFDFAADARNEGGKPGQNQKGLTTFDRKEQKDAYYAYKAVLSDEPFVKLGKKGYINREAPATEVKVYSNEPEVTLFVDEKPLETKSGDLGVFTWEVPISGEHHIKAVGSKPEIVDEMIIRKVDEKDPDYIVQGGSVHNWFADGVEREGYLSIMDTFADVMSVPEAAAKLMPILEGMSSLLGPKDEDSNKTPEELAAEKEKMGAMMKMFPVETALRMSQAMSQEEIVELNKVLNQIPRPDAE